MLQPVTCICPHLGLPPVLCHPQPLNSTPPPPPPQYAQRDSAEYVDPRLLCNQARKLPYHVASQHGYPVLSNILHPRYAATHPRYCHMPCAAHMRTHVHTHAHSHVCIPACDSYSHTVIPHHACLPACDSYPIMPACLPVTHTPSSLPACLPVTQYHHTCLHPRPSPVMPCLPLPPPQLQPVVSVRRGAG